MGKAKKVEVVKSEEVKNVTSTEQGFKAKDLSLEKRVELYSKDFESFKLEKLEQYGLMLDVEMARLPKGTFPRMVLTDPTKTNEKNN